MSIASIKRFIEAFNADPQFRSAFRADPVAGMAQLGLPLDPDRLKPIWDRETQALNAVYKKTHGSYPEASPELEEYRRYHEAKIELTRMVQSESSPGDPRLRAWRDRQVARVANQVLEANAAIVVHSPVAFELSVGCSVGCYFCSLDAPKLSEVFEYTEENSRLWKDVLNVVNEVLSPAGKHGFCYWATDPLDNPDYERFCVDFAGIMGRFPQTTTAKALVSVPRTKALLKLSEQWTPRIINRFSILTTRGLRDVHKEFSPEELERVELVTLNPDGDTVKTKSGRYYQLCQDKPEVWEKEVRKIRDLVTARFSEAEWQQFVETLDQRTCGCVSGFLFNMVHRTVRMISPCVPSPRHPKGYITFAEARFESGADLKRVLEEMIARHAPDTLPGDLGLRFREDLSFEPSDAGFLLHGKLSRTSFENAEKAGYIRYLGRRVADGGQTAASIALTAQFQFGVAPLVTHATLNDFFRRGIFEEAPANGSAARLSTVAESVESERQTAATASCGQEGSSLVPVGTCSASGQN